MGYGFRSAALGPSAPFGLCLPNATLFAFRSPAGPHPLTARQVSGRVATDHALKRTVRHFSLSHDCVVLESPAAGAIGAWLLPADLCPDINIVNVYGSSYAYALRLPPARAACLFFEASAAPHHVALSAAHANASFRAEFYTHGSLAERTFARAHSAAGPARFSSPEPFFVRLPGDGGAARTLHVGLATLRLSALFTECRAEELDALDDLPPDGSRPHAAEASAGVCANPIDAIALFWGYALLVAGITLAVVAVLNWRGWIAWRSLCGSAGRAPREAIATVGQNAEDTALVVSDGGEIGDAL
jgi:hypothetical protein